MGPPRLASDIELALAAGRGDRRAFGELARRSAPVVAAMLRRMGAPAALADDLTQDALLAALNAIAGYRGDGPFMGWVMRIAARLYLKRRRREARIVLMADPPDGRTAEPATDSDLRLDIDRAIARLSPPERLCVSLHHGAGLTYDEIGRALQVPPGTVKSHVSRGSAKLRTLLASPERRAR